MAPHVFDMSRKLSPGQRSVVHIGRVDGQASVEIYVTSEMLLEAPNWAGPWLYLNGNGHLWRLAADGRSAPEKVDIDGLPPINNDHVLAVNGATMYASAFDGHIYRAPLWGGSAVRITNTHDGEPGYRLHFLHGLSPDGSTLAYTGVHLPSVDLGSLDTASIYSHIWSLPAPGGVDRQLTLGDRNSDGAEFSRDGEWIYFNTELFTEAPGHAQIARMRTDGSDKQQLTFDDNVNWFPHLSPDGGRWLYLSYPPGTVGHPENRPVEIKLVTDDWTAPTTLVRLFGGQGTINVNSWSPDGTQFAFVSYPIG